MVNVLSHDDINHRIQHKDVEKGALQIENEILEKDEDNEGNEDNEDINRCLICNCDMGRDNPRQLCGKIQCLDEY